MNRQYRPGTIVLAPPSAAPTQRGAALSFTHTHAPYRHINTYVPSKPWFIIILLLFIACCLFAHAPIATTFAAPSPQQWHTFTTDNGIAGNSVQSIWEDPHGNIWISTENGISRYDGTIWKTYRADDGLRDNNVWSLSGNEDSIWCATSSGVSVLQDEAWHHYTTDHGLPINDIRAILVAHDGTVWAGTFGQGIARKLPDATQWETLPLPEWLQDKGMVVQSIWQAPNHDIWFSTNGFGALRWRNGELEEFTFRLGRHNTVWAVGASPNGNSTWLATLRGIVRIANDDSVELIDETVGGISIVEAEVLAVAGGENDIWFGTRTHGVFHRSSDSTWQRYTIQDGLGRNYIMTILVDQAGRVWFGTRGNGITMLDPRPLDTAMLQTSVMGHDMSNNTSLPNDNPKLSYNQNNLQFDFSVNVHWLPPQDVAFHYSLDTPNATTPRKQKRMQATPQGNAISEMFLDLVPGTYTLHTYAVVGETKGPEATFDFTIQSAPPNIVSEALNIQSNGQPIQQERTLPPTLLGGNRQIVIHLTARDDVTQPQDVIYRYRMLDAEQWQPIVSDDITLSLPQGQHRIEIQAIDGDDNLSEPLSLAIMVPAPLWYTFLFYIILVLIPSLIGVVIGAVSYSRWTRQQALRRAVNGHFIPYDVGPLITTTDRYIGRQHILDTILGKLQNNSFYIHGEKRIGKTSMLLQIQQRLEQRNLMNPEQHTITVFRNMQDLPQQQFWLYLVRSIAAAMQELPTDLSYQQSHAPSTYDDFDAENDIEHIIAYRQQQQAHHQLLIVLLLDEVDTFYEYDPFIRQRFRAFCQHMQQWVRVVLAGVQPPRGDESDTSPWYNIFEPIQLGPLAKKDIRHLIRSYNNNPYDYTAEAEEALIAAGTGKPYDTQWLCSESVKAMLAAKRICVQMSDVEHAVQVLARERDSLYSTHWQQLDEQTQQHIRTIRQNGMTFSIEQSKRHTIEQLLDIGMLRQTDNEYQLSVIAQYWLQEHP